MQPSNKPFHRTRYSRLRPLPQAGERQRWTSALSGPKFQLRSIAQPNDRVHDRAAQSLFGQQEIFGRSLQNPGYRSFKRAWATPYLFLASAQALRALLLAEHLAQ